MKIISLIVMMAVIWGLMIVVQMSKQDIARTTIERAG